MFKSKSKTLLTSTFPKSGNRAEIGLARQTEPDDSQPDPDCPDNLEPAARKSGSGRPGPNAHPCSQPSLLKMTMSSCDRVSKDCNLFPNG